MAVRVEHREQIGIIFNILFKKDYFKISSKGCLTGYVLE
jgi:hypothetical protein